MNTMLRLTLTAVLTAAVAWLPAQDSQAWDFRNGDQGWTPSGGTGDVTFTADGVVLEVDALDPMYISPDFAPPADRPLRVSITMRSDTDGVGQVFYRRPYTEARSVAFAVPGDEEWFTVRFTTLPMNEGGTLRIDPLVDAPGTVTIAEVRYDVSPGVTTLQEWDFSDSVEGWFGNPRIESITSEASGMRIVADGEDPWVESSDLLAFDPEQPVTVVIRARTDADGGAELFWGDGFDASRSVRFLMTTGGPFAEYRLNIGALPELSRFRIDPSAGSGVTEVAWMRIDTAFVVDGPELAVPVRPGQDGGEPLVVASGGIEVAHFGGGWGDYIVRWQDREMASGTTGDFLGMLSGEEPEWQFLDGFATTVSLENGELTESVSTPSFNLVRRFAPGPRGGVIDVSATLEVKEPVGLLHVPWLTLFPGLGTYGERKAQGILAGIEYLADEPSSSDLDVRTVEQDRRVPDDLKLTIPLMALVHDGDYIGLAWDKDPMVQVIHDTPDRTFGSGGHLYALWGPAVGEHRNERDLFASDPVHVQPGDVFSAGARIIAGTGGTVVEPVKDWVALEGGFPGPTPAPDWQSALRKMAHGWVDSGAFVDGMWRHAVWPGFGPAPAADAVAFARVTAEHLDDQAMSAKLMAAADLGMQVIVDGNADPHLAGGVSHVRPPWAILLLGSEQQLFDRIAGPARGARQALARFGDDGIVPYEPPADGPDYSEGHFANHANGLSSRILLSIMENITLSGDEDAMAEAVEVLDMLTALYRGTVPRGAQTWEIPLHTPDILASAHLVRAYVLGYHMTGREDLLDEARYWAWTGVPFLYLRNPTEGPIGLYATIVVLGGTNWAAPFWIGLPVQWCGLVYGSALHELAKVDDSQPWAMIAKAITISGWDQSWDTGDEERQGLLPDFFHLRSQVSDGPAINPGTVQSHLAEVYGESPIYGRETVVFPSGKRMFLHAPCGIEDVRVAGNELTFRLVGQGGLPYRYLLTSVDTAPEMVWSGNNPDTMLPAAAVYREDLGAMTQRVAGTHYVRVVFPATATYWQVR